MKEGNDFIKRLEEEHVAFSEEADLLEKVLPFLKDKKTFDDINRIINFFQENLVSHIKYEEEKMFTPVLAMGELEVKQIVRELQQEHIYILSKFDKIKDIVFKNGLTLDDDAVKDEFIELCRDLIGVLLRHAKKEDDKFFPYLKDKNIEIDFGQD